jgi:hypothetical protein
MLTQNEMKTLRKELKDENALAHMEDRETECVSLVK